jgi:hypothetical protein
MIRSVSGLMVSSHRHRVRPARNCAGVLPRAFPDFVPTEVSEIEDPQALDMLSKLQRVNVATEDAPAGVPTCVYGTPPAGTGPVLLMLHGFDSSS